MRILLVADEESKYIWDHYQPGMLDDVDLILSCGDLKADYLTFLVTMSHAPPPAMRPEANAHAITPSAQNAQAM